MDDDWVLKLFKKDKKKVEKVVCLVVLSIDEYFVDVVGLVLFVVEDEFLVFVEELILLDFV